jgi:hypothetical protein
MYDTKKESSTCDISVLPKDNRERERERERGGVLHEIGV